jgi:hypothetical protein
VGGVNAAIEVGKHELRCVCARRAAVLGIQPTVCDKPDHQGAFASGLRASAYRGRFLQGALDTAQKGMRGDAPRVAY